MSQNMELDGKRRMHRLTMVGNAAGTGRIGLVRLTPSEAFAWYVRAFTGQEQPYSVLRKTDDEARMFNEADA